MVEIDEIENVASLNRWLLQQPPKVSVAIASRSAMRALPIFWSWTLSEQSELAEHHVLATIRAVLASVELPQKTNTSLLSNLIQEILDAGRIASMSKANPATVAANVINEALLTRMHLSRPDSLTGKKRAGAMRRAATNATSCVSTLATVLRSDDVWKQIRVDCRSIENADATSVLDEPLWADENPVSANWRAARTGLDALRAEKEGETAADAWKIWIEWYDDLLDGVPQDWLALGLLASRHEEAWATGVEEVKAALGTRPRVSNGGTAENGKRIAQENFVEQETNSIPKLKSSGQNAQGAAIVESILAERFQVEIDNLESQVAAVQSQIEAAQSELSKFSKTEQKLKDLLDSQIGRFEDISNTANETQKEVSSWARDLQTKFEERVAIAEATLKEQHALAAPTELWSDKESEHETRMKSAYGWFVGCLLATGVGLGLGLVTLMSYREPFARFLAPAMCDPITSPELCKGISVPSMITVAAILTMFTLVLWFTRLKMKEYLAERHLMVDAREKRAFSEAYIGLLAAGDAGGDAKDHRAVVDGALFRPSSDGIVREEGGLDPSLAAGISKLLSK